MAGIFKAYDIRGIYGTDLTDEIAFKIGRAVATFLKPKTFVIGHDMRPHSTPLFEAMAKGLTMQAQEFRSIALRPILSSGMPFRAFSISLRVHKAHKEIKSLI